MPSGHEAVKGSHTFICYLSSVLTGIITLAARSKPRLMLSYDDLSLVAYSLPLLRILSARIITGNDVDIIDLPSYSAKAQALIDWEPEYSLTTGVKEMLAYYWT